LIFVNLLKSRNYLKAFKILNLFNKMNPDRLIVGIDCKEAVGIFKTIKEAHSAKFDFVTLSLFKTEAKPEEIVPLKYFPIQRK